MSNLTPTQHRSTLALILNAAIAVGGLLFLASLLHAALAMVQSDYLGAKSEAAGGFDPTVFPPYDTVTWLIALAAPVGIGALLGLIIAARLAFARERS